MSHSRCVPKITVYLWILRVILIGFSAAAVSIFLKAFLLSCFIIAVAGILLIYLPFFLKSYRICLSGGIFYLEYGLIFRTTRLFPIKNAIYVKSLETPILKALGLAGLEIKTVKSVIFLPELKCCDAQYLMNYLEEKICEREAQSPPFNAF